MPVETRRPASIVRYRPQPAPVPPGFWGSRPVQVSGCVLALITGLWNVCILAGLGGWL
jgi:hypothetical protein